MPIPYIRTVINNKMRGSGIPKKNDYYRRNE